MVYSSDQGFFLGDHGWFDKRFMYEESLRMPLIMRYPRAIAAESTHDGIVTNVDFARTFLEAAGVEPHERMQRRSFWGDLVGEPTSPPAEGMYYGTGRTTTGSTRRRRTTATAMPATS